MNKRELNVGNLVFDRGDKVLRIDGWESNDKILMKTGQYKSQFELMDFHPLTEYVEYLRPIGLTEETLKTYIAWTFEKGFNLSVKENQHWIKRHYLLENIIDGSSDFEIVFSKSKYEDLIEITYYVDDTLLEFALDDTIHNLQNLFYMVSGQELPIKNATTYGNI